MLYDAEHFFDGYRRRPDYALRLPARRGRAPAPRPSCCCDTNGGSLPDQIAAGDGRGRARQLAADSARVGIHCHNDAGCGVANSLAAVRRGATHVQGTINGYGERCGNANLVTIIPNLQLKLGYDVREPGAARAR